MKDLEVVNPIYAIAIGAIVAIVFITVVFGTGLFVQPKPSGQAKSIAIGFVVADTVSIYQDGNNTSSTSPNIQDASSEYTIEEGQRMIEKASD